MPIFHKEKKDRAIIIGCGRLGSALANLLSDENAHVTVMDRDESAFRKLSPSYGGLILEGDGSDFDTLVEAGAHEATLLAATTEDDDVNIMVGQIAREILHIETVIVRLNDTAKEAAFAGSGIITFSPAQLCVNEFRRVLGEKER
ncbi:MAG: TrkA family potassium uptake protein [Oscillospiraceae bacterium]|jgi:trk system potassium uptake protein TrkA|nr:TrkA family potassium uptake protein [Oscillospiraceae bacterium]